VWSGGRFRPCSFYDHHLSIAGKGLLEQSGHLPDPVPDGSVLPLRLAGPPMELLPLAGVQLGQPLADGAEPGHQGAVFCDGLPQTLGPPGGRQRGAQIR